MADTSTTSTPTFSNPSYSSNSGNSGFGTALAGAALGSALVNGAYGGGGYQSRGRMVGAMPIINSNSPDGRASFTYFDPMELKPRDPVAASLSGALGGAFGGAAIGGIPMIIAYSANRQFSGGGWSTARWVPLLLVHWSAHLRQSVTQMFTIAGRIASRKSASSSVPIKTPAPSAKNFVQPAFSSFSRMRRLRHDRLHLDSIHVFPGLRQVIRKLHLQPRLGNTAKCLGQPDRHLRRNPGMTVENVR